ncbi:MAG: hypothetical protein IPM74_03140 [Crocinitomicaceae bacterium]|nr:hypothetical protein [Crocinitomicaceae bacterium]MBK8924911.1 hypothetical protein [Crocinitomicaceae bacterium]
MKTLLITLSLFISGISFADCAGSGLYCWPDQTEVAKNPLFLITGYAMSQEVIHELTISKNVYLVSPKDKVELKLLQLEEGGYYLTQVGVYPERNLIPGETYHLKIDDMEGNLPTRYNEKKREYESVFWKVLDKKDTIAPVWIQRPAFDTTSTTYFGCGPARYAFFTAQVKDESPFLIRATLKNLDKNNETTFSFSMREGKIVVGHGMCSGEFSFGDSKNFEVSFDLIDASGNMTAWTGDPITFESPE